MLFTPRQNFLVGVDSDGCVFDTMEVKQLRHFLPNVVQHWNLQPIEPHLRAVMEHINLRSRHRGSNRFAALLLAFQALHAWDEVRKTGTPLPPTRDLTAWVHSGEPLSNTTLAPRAAHSPELHTVLEWSRAVNRDIAENMAPNPPFPGVAEALDRLHARADLLVVSLTPREALQHEWTLHGLRDKVDAIAGQECGAKARQLQMALQPGNYPPEHVLVIGDAPGDLQAARDTGASFYPIISGQETACWKHLLHQDIDRFFQGNYRGKIENTRIAAFESALDTPPPWER